MPAGLRAPEFRLRNEEGEPISMRALRGRPVVVTFLYTHCQDSCPIQAQTVRGALDDLGHDVPALAIAVDPPNDTPQSARKFLAEQRATGRIQFVLGSREQLRPLWKGYAITPQRVTQEHMARITLVDGRGFQRVGYPGSEATPERLAHDLALLERQAR
jgi:protein SCO1/2